MATAIPSSMTFEMLSRLPPNSFVQVWKEIRPSVAPANNQYTIQSNGTQRVNFVIRGAPNEFLLNTNCYLAGSAYTKALIDPTTELTSEGITTARSLAPVLLNKPLHFFQSSRESFNSGSLPFLDNQDTTASHEYNELRASFVQRNQPRALGEQDLEDCESWLGSATGVYEVRGFPTADSLLSKYSAPFRGVYKSGASTWNTFVSGKNNDFRIPLGVYSNLVNSHSVIPIGLMSSYSVNGWQLDLDISNQSGNEGVAFSALSSFAVKTEEGTTTYPVTLPSTTIADLRIYACIIRVLDPSVMEAVLSLYEKREMVNVGGVQFPLSLRLNSLGYRFSRFPLTQPQTDYYFRITGTDRSVRALAWRVFSTSRNTSGNWTLKTSDQSGLCLTRLETMIGSELPHPVIEDVTPATTNVSNFIALNTKRSASLFSPLPYYQEGVKHDGDASDNWMRYNNAFTSFESSYTDVSGLTQPASRFSVCQGMISFENLDRREGDFSGSFQASGKDLTNVGAIELRMRFQKLAPVTSLSVQPTDTSLADKLTFSSSLTDAESDYQIVFAYVYDSVMEVSPQGVMDITNATL
jgi:hypothetical protein